jgi:hypothetical protein
VDENGDFIPLGIRAGQFGDSRGRVNLASLFSGFFWKRESKAIEKKRKVNHVLYSVDL